MKSAQRIQKCDVLFHSLVLSSLLPRRKPSTQLSGIHKVYKPEQNTCRAFNGLILTPFIPAAFSGLVFSSIRLLRFLQSKICLYTSCLLEHHSSMLVKYSLKSFLPIQLSILDVTLVCLFYIHVFLFCVLFSLVFHSLHPCTSLKTY